MAFYSRVNTPLDSFQCRGIQANFCYLPWLILINEASQSLFRLIFTVDGYTIKNSTFYEFHILIHKSLLVSVKK